MTMLRPQTLFLHNLNPDKLLQSNSSDNRGQEECQEYVAEILKWLCIPPKISTLRINSLSHTREEIFNILEKYFLDKHVPVKVEKHPLLQEVIILHHNDPCDLHIANIKNEVMVDTDCASAVLRGSNIFAPGLMGMTVGTNKGDRVKVYTDLSSVCKKGFQKVHEGPNKILVAIGMAKMNRYELFGANVSPRGVAVEILENKSGCPVIDTALLPLGSTLLQNLPSIICVHNLDPKEEDVVLDMCAAPGNKTTHIAALMKNKGTLIAIDKTPARVELLRKTCRDFKANAQVFMFDSTKLEFSEDNYKYMDPPFPKETFDKILLDAPCSGLGKRPQLRNTITEKVLRSYVPLQRKLFETAVKLLKSGGTLVYSTCTITVAENEGIVTWALKTFEDCLELSPCILNFRTDVLNHSPLKPEHRNLVQRFGPNSQIDSVGFFIARFTKK